MLTLVIQLYLLIDNNNALKPVACVCVCVCDNHRAYVKYIMFLMFCSVVNKHTWLRAVSVLKMMSIAGDQFAKLEPNSSVFREELELRERGELLRRLAMSSVLLDIVLSVAVYVIIYKLLKSGDVEKNPGPGNLDYNSVDASQVLGTPQFNFIINIAVNDAL